MDYDCMNEHEEEYDDTRRQIRKASAEFVKKMQT